MTVVGSCVEKPFAETACSSLPFKDLQEFVSWLSGENLKKKKMKKKAKDAVFWTCGRVET